MSSPLKRITVAVGLGLALATVPAAAQASAVDLGTAKPFVVLGGSTVTNTGPSVLGGDLGVSPGTALVGFGLPAVVGGATHANDAVALQAQADLTTAYGVAAGQPVAPADDLTGVDLGGRTLTAGAYRFTSSAQLTGQVTFDAQGDPAAQFVVEVASTLITAPASSVRLVNGASACNIYWQVGSSATLDTATAFQGNVLALTSITLNTGATATGRMLARNGAVTLDTNVLVRPDCATGSTTTPAGTTPPAGTPVPTGPVPAGPVPAGPVPAGPVPAGPVPAGPVSPGSPSAATPPLAVPVPSEKTHGGTSIFVGSPRGNCTAGFRGAVGGRRIKHVAFSIDRRRLTALPGPGHHVYVLAGPGMHWVRARVTYTDATRARTLKLRYRACAAAVLRPRPGPAAFTG
ncbi:ice-binding family protein [Paraconexibacter antarcticus]|uniref:Ice-binding family protein n=1 Tax=Paraconexibacter antarcticus TaxID=2949664 RepID=A0ABY5DV42_9ACTN|nr:ice-binding family protein [Paraconexibacter antarcticus]UTI64921.1 ice-binding family protein [Paraconexibacter antarcticus]